MTSSVRAASSPTRSASAIASAAPIRLTAASRLLTSFVRAVADALADPEHRVGERFEQPLPPREDALFARDHQAHRSGPRARRATRHRRVDGVDRGRGEARSDRLGARRRDRRAEDDAAAGAHRRGDAVVAEQDVLALRGVDDGDDDDLGAARELGWRCSAQRARLDRERLARRIDVANVDLGAAIAQAKRHRQAHVADADDADRALLHPTIVTSTTGGGAIRANPGSAGSVGG